MIILLVKHFFFRSGICSWQFRPRENVRGSGGVIWYSGERWNEGCTSLYYCQQTRFTKYVSLNLIFSAELYHFNEIHSKNKTYNFFTNLNYLKAYRRLSAFNALICKMFVNLDMFESLPMYFLHTFNFIFTSMSLFADALSPSKVIDQLNLNKLTGRKWYVQAACATTGEGIYEGMHHLASMVKEFKKEG